MDREQQDARMIDILYAEPDTSRLEEMYKRFTDGAYTCTQCGEKLTWDMYMDGEKLYCGDCVPIDEEFYPIYEEFNEEEYLKKYSGFDWADIDDMIYYEVTL